ncbi:MAG TPA: MerR family transcriptional regulator [Desulfomicrobiaceae bacterium]|nr:MerR family transcriptional regulator [Desulfomicrobiaceae bacterium]
MFTIGRLARKHGLSRSTLLYYDRIGLLHPSEHTRGEYRLYSDADDARLARICAFRRAGLALKDIGRILDEGGSSNVTRTLENRLTELNAEMNSLREQQRLIAGLLGHRHLSDDNKAMDRKRWTSLLKNAGFSEKDMRNWHMRFERSAPLKHEQFLRHLHIPDTEISAIRAMAAAPHEILNINKESGRFMEVFFKLYEGLKREGPGSPAMTRQAYEMCTGLPDTPSILEPGCGTGGATMDLARITDGTIVATDVYQPFLDTLMQRAEALGVSGRVSTRLKDMSDLDFPPHSFDLIWCEGAAYIMGVDKALSYWKQFLKPGGCLVFSDLVWLTADAPDEVREFWKEGYPAMRTAKDNEQAAEKLGYVSLGHFIIDDACWEEFYNDVEQRMNEVEPEYRDDPDGRAIIDSTRLEIDLYRRHPGMYGYCMHVLKA